MLKRNEGLGTQDSRGRNSTLNTMRSDQNALEQFSICLRPRQNDRQLKEIEWLVIYGWVLGHSRGRGKTK